jgi:hypothetical protein
MRAKGSRRTMSPGPSIADARLWIVGAIVVFLISFSAARWLPDLMTGSPDNVSTPTAGTSTSTSEVTTTSLQQSDNSRSVTPNPLIPIVIRRSTSPEASDLPPQTEISSARVTVPESVDTVTAPQQLDLRDIENAKRVQQRLIDLGFLYGAADGVWGQRSRRALQEFRAANGLGESDIWNEATQEQLLRAPDAKAAKTSGISFIVDGVLTLLSVGIPLSQSRRAEPRPLAPHVNFIQLNGKARVCGDCELSARATPNAGTQTFDLRFPQAS